MLMNKRGIGVVTIIVILVVLGVVGYIGVKNLGFVGSAERVNPVGVQRIDSSIGVGVDVGESEEDLNSGMQNHVVEFISGGYSPKTLEIKAGDSVTFINRDSRKTWPASNIHPTHTVYPGSGIQKCGTSEESNIFDACHGLVKDESYTFTFDEIGEWRYHDHLSPGRTGIIIVI